jgi:hypothetical protein
MNDSFSVFMLWVLLSFSTDVKQDVSNLRLEHRVTTFETKDLRIYGYMREKISGSLINLRYEELHSLISTPNIIIIIIIIIIITTTTTSIEMTSRVTHVEKIIKAQTFHLQIVKAKDHLRGRKCIVCCVIT